MVSKRNIIDVTILIPENAFLADECSSLVGGLTGVVVLFTVDVDICLVAVFVVAVSGSLVVEFSDAIVVLANLVVNFEGSTLLGVVFVVSVAKAVVPTLLDVGIILLAISAVK